MSRLAAALVAAAFLLTGMAGPASATTSTSAQVEHVVVVGIAGLRWSDVSAAHTPVLARLAGSGSVGSLSVRAAPAVTCPAEGWLTLGSGTYSAVKDPAALDPPRGCRDRPIPAVRRVGHGGLVADLPALRKTNDQLKYGATPGLLGEGVPCASAVGPGAALAVADETGRVAQYAPTLPTQPGPLLARCPVAVVDLGGLAENPDARLAALHRFDRVLGRIDAARPPGSVLIVVGVSEVVADKPRLHVALADGPGFRGGWLASTSTRRAPYVQLCDLAPTTLSLLGAKVPTQIAGRPWTGEADGRPDHAVANSRALIDTDRAAVAQRNAIPAFFLGYASLLLAVLTGLAVVTRRRRHGRPVSALIQRSVTFTALGAMALPVATFLANLVPWWRAPAPAAAAGMAAVVAAAVMAGLACAGPWRRSARAVITAIAGLTLAVFGADLATGGRLQIHSMLGYNPLVAGRFVGMGGIAFAVFGAAVVFAAAALADARPQRVALAWVIVIGVPAVVVDGLPSLGAKFGGVLTLVPALVLLALLVTRTRVTPMRLLAAGAAGIMVVTAISVVDYLAPASSRSHFGAFVATVMEGGGQDVLRRKLLTNLDLLFGPLQALALGIVVLAAILVLMRPPAALRETYDRQPWLRTALVTMIGLGAVGFAVNDSGIAVPLVAGMVALPAVLATCAWPDGDRHIRATQAGISP